MSAGDVFSDRPTTVPQYVAILRRRRWIIIALPILTALVAYLVSTTQSSVYQSTAEISFNRSAGTQTLNLTSVDPVQFLETQSKVAESPDLAQRVVDAAGVPGVTAGKFRGNSSATPDASGGDVLDLSASASNRADAVALANAYANEFTNYRTELWQASNNDGLRKANALLQSARAHGLKGTQAYETLLQQKFQLQYDNSVIASITKVLQPASSAAQTQPRPRRDAVIGALLGLLLGIGLAFLAEALDSRVRSEAEIGETLGLPLLGRVPAPPKKLQRANKLVMAEEPTGVNAEVFRKLRTSFEFLNLDQGARTIMVTSAGPREGKSTTAANLALALARAGRNVVLADLDLRRPTLHTYFGTGREPGLTDAAVGRADLEDVTRTMTLPALGNGFDTGALARAATEVLDSSRPTPAQVRAHSNGHVQAKGVLHFLPAGTMPAAADEFLERDGVNEVLEQLANEFDLVVLDTPPLLAVGDAQTLSAKVDAMLVVAGTGIHRRQLEELARQLRNCPAPILGYVLTGVSHSDSYSYGYGYDPHVYDTRSQADTSREPL